MTRRTLLGLAGVIGLVVAIVLATFQPTTFFHAYLFAVLAWLNPALGCLLLTFIHRMTGGKWGDTLRPFFCAGAATVPWALLFAVPLFFGLRHLFPWTVPDPNPLLVKHPTYLSPAGYMIRGVLYVVSYSWLILLTRSNKSWTGPIGMIVYVVTTYLLSVDWLVALEPGWYSTGFPVVLMASQGVSALALSIAAATWLKPQGNEDDSARRTWIDLGNLMLGSLMFWAYVSYGEFLIVWSSNLPEQSAWYVHRNTGGWHYVLIGLVLLNLLAPVLLLLCGGMKRRFRGFALLTSGVVVLQIVYLAWLIMPSFRTNGISLHAVDVILPLALGGLFLFCYLRYAQQEVARDG